MFAVIRTGGKQYKVAKNQVILIERLEVEAGQKITLDKVLMVGNGLTTTVGAPLVANVEVVATVEEQIRGKKEIVFKKKRRHNYRRKQGHRQYLTVLRIVDILENGKPIQDMSPAVIDAIVSNIPDQVKKSSKKEVSKPSVDEKNKFEQTNASERMIEESNPISNNDVDVSVEDETSASQPLANDEASSE